MKIDILPPIDFPYYTVLFMVAIPITAILADQIAKGCLNRQPEETKEQKMEQIKRLMPQYKWLDDIEGIRENFAENGAVRNNHITTAYAVFNNINKHTEEDQQTIRKFMKWFIPKTLNNHNAYELRRLWYRDGQSRPQ